VIDFQSYTETALLGALTRAPVRVRRRFKTSASWLYRQWIDVPHPATYMPFAHLDTLVQAGLIEAVPSGLGKHFIVPVQARTAWRTTLAGLLLPAAAPRIGLFVGAAQANRRWPAERFARLAIELDQVSSVPLSFVVIAGPGEGRLADAVVQAAGSALEGRLVRAHTGSLLEVAAAFEDCVASVCNDTGPLHQGERAEQADQDEHEAYRRERVIDVAPHGPHGEQRHRGIESGDQLANPWEDLVGVD
jgi:ADP-heptose:LPS heptosyltransferase